MMSIKRFNALAEQYKQEQERKDFRIAMICTLIANAFRNPKRAPFKVEDFMPREKAQKSPDEILAAVKALQRRFKKRSK